MHFGASQYLWLQHGSRLVHFSRERIHQLLLAQTEVFQNAQARGAAVASDTIETYARSIAPATLAKMEGQLVAGNQRKHTIHVSAAQWEKPQGLPVFQPAAPAEWAKAATFNAGQAVYFQVGPWILKQASQADGSYISVAGSAEKKRPIGGALFDLKSGREVVPEDYAGLWSHVQESLAGQDIRGRGISQLVREMLRGKTELEVPASLAAITGALFIAEVGRRPATHPINLICLDLIDRGRLTWDDLMSDGKHPVARGGGMNKDQTEVIRMETDLLMQWLPTLSLPSVVEFEPNDSPSGEPAGPADESLVKGLLQTRMDSSGDANAMLVSVGQRTESVGKDET